MIARSSPSKKRERRVKAWATIDETGYLKIAFNHAHNVFQHRVYASRGAAEKVADVVVTGGPKLTVVPVTIIYSLPKTISKKI